MSVRVPQYDMLASRGGVDAPPTPPTPFVVLDPSLWVAQPPTREWVVQDWIPKGVVTALYGDGGMGKSLLAQQLMCATALGQPFLGLPTLQGKALGIMCEDDPDELHRRQFAINRQMGCDPSAWRENLRLVSRLGEDNVLMSFDGRDVGQLTPVFEMLDRLCGSIQPSLLICDTIADFFGGNENDRSQVRQFVQNTFGRLARKYRCAVLVCGHPSVSGMASGAGTGGSTAWNNTVRSRLYLTKPECEDAHPNARLLSRKKANYAARDAEIQMLWNEGAFEASSATQARVLPDWSVISAMLDMIEEGWRANNPWSIAAQTKSSGRYFPAAAAKKLGVPEQQAQRLVSDWLIEGHVVADTLDKHSKTKGLRVVRRFDREAR